jgi:hypothetical protein
MEGITTLMGIPLGYLGCGQLSVGGDFSDQLFAASPGVMSVA